MNSPEAYLACGAVAHRFLLQQRQDGGRRRPQKLGQPHRIGPIRELPRLGGRVGSPGDLAAHAADALQQQLVVAILK